MSTHQPAAELPAGHHFFQRTGGAEHWQPCTRDELLRGLHEPTPPAFRTALGIAKTDDDGRPTALEGPFYADFDGELTETCRDFREFLGKLVAMGVSPPQCRLYATGGRGFHVEIPQAVFCEPGPVDDLHLTYKEMAQALKVPTLDMRVYSVKRMWRVPNIERENGMFKVPLTPDEALAISPERYADLCASPRPHQPLEPATRSEQMAKLFQQTRAHAYEAVRRKPLAKVAADDFRSRTGGKLPPTVDDLMRGRLLPRPDAGWNQVAMQLALVAQALGMDEDATLDRCSSLIDAHKGDGTRYDTPKKREHELINQFRYLDGNPRYDISIGALIAILPEGTDADDLRDMLEPVPDHGFCISDLMTGHGKQRKLRKDVEALLQLLTRDRRLDGLCFFDTFGQAMRASRSWREAMEMEHAPTEPGELNDDHARALQHWFAREWGLTVGRDAVHDCMASWARTDSRNLVTDRLNALAQAWDGRPRLDSWLTDYAHAVTCEPGDEDDGGGEDFEPFVRAAGRKWLISAVARAFNPGCQADVALVLTGAQGFRKSSIIRLLGEALGADAFADGFDLADHDPRNSLLKLRGRLIVEWAEMSGLTKRDVREVKNFLTQRDDAYRQPYDRVSRKWPRTCVIAGTANETELFADATGNRRFWTVEVGQRISQADMGRLRADVGQIWGEACARYKNGEIWWIDPETEPELAPMAERRQAVAQVFGRFDEMAVELASRTSVQNQGWLTVTQVQAWCAEMMHRGTLSEGDWKLLAMALKRQGWESRKRTKAKRIYYRPGTELLKQVAGVERGRG